MAQRLGIEQVRSTLAMSEGGGLLERSVLLRNDSVYKKGAIRINDGVADSMLDSYLRGREHFDAGFGRYKDGREHPFFLQSLDVKQLVERRNSNIGVPRIVSKNLEIMNMYIRVLDSICKPGEDPDDFGSTVEKDTNCLQRISYRVHFGEVVAQVKLGEKPQMLVPLIAQGKWDAIREELRNKEVEGQVIERVREKCARAGLNDRLTQQVSGLYNDEIMPMTLSVEVEYLKLQEIR